MAKKKKKSAKKKSAGYKGFTGKKSKLGVAHFWVRMFTQQPRAMLTDAQIINAMGAEFPQAKEYTAADVVIFRNRFNNGNLADQSVAPKDKVGEYISCTHCRKGVRMPAWGEKGQAAKPKKAKITKKKSKVTKKKASRKTSSSVISKASKKKATKKKATKKG